MTWQHPYAFWFLLVPLALALWELSRRARAQAALRPKVLRAEASPGRLQLASAGPAVRPRPRWRWRLWLGLACAVVALARPQWGQVEEEVFDQAREILIAVDLSRSMLAPDVPPSRLERARLLITSLLERLEGERVGLIVFAGTAFLQSPLSADYEILREFLPALAPDFLPQGGTDYNAMLEAALDGFGRGDAADRYLIILSDGESQSDAWQARLDELRERRITVLALGIGTPEGAMLPDGAGGFVKDERGAVVLSRLNASTLEELARRTGGAYRDASRWVDLADLLSATVESGRQGEFTEVSRVRRIERFQWVLAPALFLLLASFWREFPVHPRPRSVPLAPRAPAARAAAATAAALVLLAGLPLTPTAAAARQAENAFAGPLTQTVARLSEQPQLSATDLAELARATVTYGERMTGSQQRPEPGAVQDGLAAVVEGERLDPDAANWSELRQQLEALLPPEEPPPPEQPPPPQDQPPPDESQSQQKQSPSQSPRQQPPEEGEGQPQDPPPNSGEPSTPPEPSDPSGQPPQEAPSAFGEMGEPPPGEPPPPEEPPTETQQVGGQTQQPFDVEQDPALTVPLQKLEQLKRQDSPAELYQLMQDPNAQPSEKGRDW